MKLRELEAEFLQLTDRAGVRLRMGAALSGADGLWFLCPKCWAENGGRPGTHGIICWFRGRVPDEASPGPGRWTPSGTGLDDLTFVPGDPATAHSVQVTGGCNWHGFIRNGEAITE